MSKPEVKIEDWTILGESLYGKTIDHPRFDDGTEVRTSTILVRPLDPKKGDKIETRNTIYLLGAEASYD